MAAKKKAPAKKAAGKKAVKKVGAKSKSPAKKAPAKKTAEKKAGAKSTLKAKAVTKAKTAKRKAMVKPGVTAASPTAKRKLMKTAIAAAKTLAKDIPYFGILNGSKLQVRVEDVPGAVLNARAFRDGVLVRAWDDNEVRDGAVDLDVESPSLYVLVVRAFFTGVETTIGGSVSVTPHQPEGPDAAFEFSGKQGQRDEVSIMVATEKGGS